MSLGSWGDDSSVGNNEDWLLVFSLKVVLNHTSNLFESSLGSVWDSNKEILGRRSIGLFVLNVGHTVDEDYVKILLLSFVISFQLAEGFGNLFFKIGWLLTCFLNYFISSIEHV